MKVTTLTGNLLAEWTLNTGPMTVGKTHRARAMSFQVGGKGINVARILNRFGAETEALAFADGAMGVQCGEWLDSMDIQHHFLPLKSEVRPGFVIRDDPDGKRPETTFLGMDATVPADSWNAACARVESSHSDWLAICGSIPGWQDSWSEAIKQLIANTDLSIAIDTYGPPLMDLVQLPVDLVKINRTELETLLPGHAGEPMAELAQKASTAFPVKNWIITDGPQSMLALMESGSRLEIVPAKIEEVSAMGSGDTFLASFLAHWRPTDDPAEALSFATACATANAASPGIGDFQIPPPEILFPEIQVVD